MKKTALAPVLLSLLFISFSNDSIAQTNEEIFTIYLIRHSEKKVSAHNEFDPPLTACGIKRSEYLSSFFEDVDIQNIYSTNYMRTKNTATPIASTKKVDIQYYDSSDLKTLSERIMDLKKNSLVIGHSNTTPVLAGLLVDEVIDPFDESIYNRIYKVVINMNKKKLFVINTTFNCHE